jgi:thiol-disulfide isomerase/thioredoxin
MQRTVRRRSLGVLVAGSLSLASSLSGQGSDSLPPLLGRPIGTFAWTSIDDSTNIISPILLRGSFVLVDLWGTWCAPCRREMPFMHEAYQRFHSRGFEILSIAFDISPQKVQVFRRDVSPMPWLHVYATAEIEAEATRLFQLDGFPRAVLLDRDGTVVRVDTGLRGAALAATLDSLLTVNTGAPKR